MNLLENIIRIQEVMGLNEREGRHKLNFFDLYDKGIIFVTKCHNLSTGEPCDGTQLITLYNLKFPSSEQKFLEKALQHPEPKEIGWWHKNQDQLTQDKYEQILKSIVIFEKSDLF